MRIIKIILIALVSFTGLYLIVSAVSPSTYRVERSVIINAPSSMVFAEINDFSHMEHWSPWVDYDPDMVTSIEGKTGQPGYRFSWDSKNKKMGKGSVTRVVTKTNRYIENALELEDYGMKSTEQWQIEETLDGIRLSWVNLGKISFAFRIPVSLMSMEKMIAPDFEKGLKRIKHYCESHNGY